MKYIDLSNLQNSVIIILYRACTGASGNRSPRIESFFGLGLPCPVWDDSIAISLIEGKGPAHIEDLQVEEGGYLVQDLTRILWKRRCLKSAEKGLDIHLPNLPWVSDSPEETVELHRERYLVSDIYLVVWSSSWIRWRRLYWFSGWEGRRKTGSNRNKVMSRS